MKLELAICSDSSGFANIENRIIFICEYVYAIGIWYLP